MAFGSPTLGRTIDRNDYATFISIEQALRPDRHIRLILDRYRVECRAAGRGGHDRDQHRDRRRPGGDRAGHAARWGYPSVTVITGDGAEGAEWGSDRNAVVAIDKTHLRHQVHLALARRQRRRGALAVWPAIVGHDLLGRWQTVRG